VPATTAGQQAGSEFVVAIEEGQSVPSVAVWVADREVVWEGCTLTTASLQGHSCADGVVLLRDGAVTPLSVVPAEPALTAMQEPAHTARQECGATVFRPQSAGGHFVVAATNACWADVSPSVLLSYDSQTLAPTVVLDLPYGTFGADQTVAYTDGPTSWVLGR